MHEIQLPGDKSISHRVAMLAAVARGVCKIRNYNSGDDCQSTLNCLHALGTDVDRKGNDVTIDPQPLRTPEEPLDCANSGSTIRMLTGLLAGQNVPAVLIGDASLRRRPMHRIVEPLRLMGAVIELLDDEYAPIRILEGVKRPIEYKLTIASAQVKTAILFAGLKHFGTRIFENVPTRDHTERLLAYLRLGTTGTIPAFPYEVPADPSAAAFFVVAALLGKIAPFSAPNLLVNPTRIAYLYKLRLAGARVELTDERTIQNEPIATLTVHTEPPKNRIEIRPEEVPGLIDEIPALSVLGTVCGFEVRGARELRTKESDRIRALVSNYRALGIDVVEWEDGFSIEPGNIKPATVKTFGDHRLAMTFAAAGLPVDNQNCASISFPEFFPLLKQLQP